MPISINTGSMKYKDPATGNFIPLNAIGDDLHNIIAPSYSDLSFPISTGTLCIYDDKLYKANRDISTSEVWTAAHWTATTVDDELNAINDDKEDKPDFVVTFSDVNISAGTATADKTPSEVISAYYDGKTIEAIYTGSSVPTKAILRNVGQSYILFECLLSTMIYSFAGTTGGTGWSCSINRLLNGNLQEFWAQSSKIKYLADPADAQDAATKNYVDTAIGGLNEDVYDIYNGKEVVTPGSGSINKLNMDEVQTGMSLNASGEPSETASRWITGFIPVEDGKQNIALTGNNVSATARMTLQIDRIAFYDSSKTFVSKQDNVTSHSVASIPSGTAYVRMSIVNDYYQRSPMVEFVDSESEISSTFVEYIEKTTTIHGIYYLNETAEDVEELKNAINGKADKANPVFTGSVSMGRKANTSVGNRSFAVGNDVEASGSHSHAEGLATTASGNYSHTEGNTSVASGSYSHAEGIMTTASGSYSHAEGNGSVASGSQSHAEGMGTASGSYSHAEGIGTASGVMSHAGGSNTIANSLSQYVFGENNIADPGFTSAGSRGTYVEIVGNGTDNNARSNARTLDWNGNEELAGDLKVFAGTNDEVSVSSLKNAINVLKPAATASDVGKALVVKTVADGKPTAFEYGESGGGGAVDDVQINGTSIVSSGVANIPIADYGQPGAFNTESGMGFGYDTVGGVKTYKVSQATSEQIKTGSNAYRPIAPQKQHEAVFYGLAKASGEDMALSANPVGTYTSEAKAAIRDMLGVPGDVQVDGTSVVNNGVANVPMASADNLGAVKIGANMQIGSSGAINFRGVGASEVKAGTSYQRALTPERQHASVFYGLAKAAGADMASSSNAIGTYTEDAKSAISEMLNGAVSVSGTTPSITAKAGVRYVCGEVSTLNIVVPSSGCIDVTFESGSTATVLTVTPPTGMTAIKWANGFDPTALEANTTYEINIMDGCLGVAGSWT